MLASSRSTHVLMLLPVVRSSLLSSVFSHGIYRRDEKARRVCGGLSLSVSKDGLGGAVNQSTDGLAVAERST